MPYSKIKKEKERQREKNMQNRTFFSQLTRKKLEKYCKNSPTPQLTENGSGKGKQYTGHI